MLPRRSDLSPRILLLGILPVLALAVVVSLHIIQSRDDTLEHARQNARQLARTLEAGVSATMQSAEIVADFVVGEVRERKAQGGKVDDLPARFIQLAHGWPFIQSVVFFEPSGHAHYAVVRGLDGLLKPSDQFRDIDLSDRPLFKVHRAASAADDPLYISGPVKSFNEHNTARLLMLTKGIWSVHGEFLGVASVAVRQDVMAAVFETAMPLADGAITLFRADATLLLSTGNTRLQPGHVYDMTWLFRGAVKQAPEDAYETVVTDDGIARVFAYRVAPRYPLVVAVGTPKSLVLADWRRSSMVLVILSALSGGVILLLTFYLLRRFRINRDVQLALRESESKLKDLIECSSDFQWATDAQGLVTVFEGYGIEKFPPMVGRPAREFFIDSADPEAVEKLLGLMTERQPVRYLRVPARGRDGEVRWVRYSANLRYGPDGAFNGYRGIGTDVTDVRRQRDIIEAHRRSEALGRLAGGLAHEINNLLQPILIYAASGASAGAGSDNRSYFVRIRRAAEHASSIVKNVLTFSRQSPPRREQTELAEVVRETIDFMAARIPETVAVHVDVPPSASCVWVDRTGCGQVITNLVTNSLEALATQPAAPGAIAVTAGVEEVTNGISGLRPGTYVHLRVADNGPGMSADVLKSMFDPFFTTKPQGQGTGLGLSVVAGLVKSWGGTVSAASELGLRTTISVYLPLAERNLQAAQ